MGDRMKEFLFEYKQIIMLGLLIGFALLLGNVRLLDTDSWQVINQHQPPLIKKGHFYLNNTVRTVLYKGSELPWDGFAIKMKARVKDTAALQIKLKQGTVSCIATLVDDGSRGINKRWNSIRAENQKGRTSIFINDEKQCDAVFVNGPPIVLKLFKEVKPVYVDDVSVLGANGEPLFKDDFGWNVFGLIQTPVTFLIAILLAFAIYFVESLVWPTVSHAITPRTIKGGLVTGWLAPIIFVLLLGVHTDYANTPFWLILAVISRTALLTKPEISVEAVPRWTNFSIGFIAICILSIAILTLSLVLKMENFPFLYSGRVFIEHGIQEFIFLLIFLSIVFTIFFPTLFLLYHAAKNENLRTGLLRLSGILSITLIGSAMARFLVKTTEGLNLVFIEKNGIHFLLSCNLGLAFFLLLHFVHVNRKKIRLSGLLSILLLISIAGSVEMGIRKSPIDQRLTPLRTGKTFTDSDALFFVPDGFFTAADGKGSGDAFVLTELNFRSGIPEHPKPEGLYRIMVMGGSNVYGDGVDDPTDTFTAKLGEILRERHPGMKIETINGGMQGYIVFQLMLMLKLYALDYSPDMIILYVNRNDSATQFGPYTLKELWETKESLPELEDVTEKVQRQMSAGESLRSKLRQSRLYNALATVIVGAREQELAGVTRRFKITKEVNPIEDYRANLEEFAAICSRNGIKLILADEYMHWHFHPGDDSRAMRIKAEMKQTAQKLGLPYLPVHQIMAEKYPGGSMMFPTDIVHLNHEGHKLVAQMLADFIYEGQYLQQGM